MPDIVHPRVSSLRDITTKHDISLSNLTEESEGDTDVEDLSGRRFRKSTFSQSFSLSLWKRHSFDEHNTRREPCEYFLLLFSLLLIIAPIGFSGFWIFAFLHGNAGFSVQFDVHCTMFPIILQVYFITVLFLLILQCICPNFRSYPQRASITCILNFFTFLCLMCLFADAIWGIVEFFRLDSNCQNSIREVGGDHFVLATETFAWAQIGLMGLAFLMCVQFCCCFCCGFFCESRLYTPHPAYKEFDYH